MTVFVICLLTPWQTAIRKKEISLGAGKNFESQTFFFFLPHPPPQAWEPQIMKRIKSLSLSQNKHKLFWHLINRRRGIVFKLRQVWLLQCWRILLFCWGSVFAFLSYIVTHLSLERGWLERWPTVITQMLPTVGCVADRSSPAWAKLLLKASLFGKQEGECTYVDIFFSPLLELHADC